MRAFTFVRDIFEDRGLRIGASEVPALFPNPERPAESVAGYGETAITLYRKKVGIDEPKKSGLAAEMGHYLEPKTVELFIREVFGKEIASEWMKKRMAFEMNGGDPAAQQAYPIFFNTAFIDNDSIVHPDGVHIGELEGKIVDTPWGFKVDTRKDFLIEAKSASFFSGKRGDSEVKGYDPTNKTWQGIPLKHWFQVQFQMLKTGIDIAYLPLLLDTNKFDVWEIKADKRMQRRILSVVNLFMSYVNKKIEPKEMAMNIDDIKLLYPDVKDDFVMLSGEDEEKIRELSAVANEAAAQEKAWAQKKDDAKSALAVYLKDYKELRDSEGHVIARWTVQKGFEDLKPLKDIKDEKVIRLLRKNGLIITTKEKRFVTAKYSRPKEAE